MLVFMILLSTCTFKSNIEQLLVPHCSKAENSAEQDTQTFYSHVQHFVVRPSFFSKIYTEAIPYTDRGGSFYQKSSLEEVLSVPQRVNTGNSCV